MVKAGWQRLLIKDFTDECPEGLLDSILLDREIHGIIC